MSDAAIFRQENVFVKLLNVLADMVSRPSGLVGLSLVGFHVVLAILSPALVPYDFTAMDSQAILSGPSAEHWLGTDNLGRDILTRTMLGGQNNMETNQREPGQAGGSRNHICPVYIAYFSECVSVHVEARLESTSHE